MDEREFWSIIESSFREAPEDQHKQFEAVARLLADRQAADLVDFQRLFDQKMADAYSWPLWGAAYLINGGCSDDAFMYFCCWLISRGEKVYSQAVRNPDSLTAVVDPQHDSYEFEELWQVARDVYKESVGDEMQIAGGDWPAEPRGERWDFDDEEETRRLLPALAGLYV